jgi:hypothetical protein
MINQVKKYAVIIVIAVLFTLFCFSIVDVIDEKPQYEDFCNYDSPRHMGIDYGEDDCEGFDGATEAEIDECSQQNGRIEYNYNSSGCPASYECNTCSYLYNEASKQHRFIGFIVTSILGLIAVIVGLYSKSEKEVVEWIYSGIMIGGILAILIGTVSYFNDMGRFVKPFVLLAEIVLIILVALKTAKKK